MGYSNGAARAVLGVMLPWMQLSVLFDCDDVPLPALKLDPDTKLAQSPATKVSSAQRSILWHCSICLFSGLLSDFVGYRNG
jgi:hypothetical protein